MCVCVWSKLRLLLLRLFLLLLLFGYFGCDVAAAIDVSRIIQKLRIDQNVSRFTDILICRYFFSWDYFIKKKKKKENSNKRIQLLLKFPMHESFLNLLFEMRRYIWSAPNIKHTHNWPSVTIRHCGIISIKHTLAAGHIIWFRMVAKFQDFGFFPSLLINITRSRRFFLTILSIFN